MKTVIKGVAWLTMVSALLNGDLRAERRNADQVFDRWINKKGAYFQRVFNEVDIAENACSLDAQRRSLFNKRFYTYRNKLNSFGKFFIATATHPSLAMTLEASNDFTLEAKQELTKIFNLLQNNVPGFVAYLKQCGFASEQLNEQELAVGYTDVLDQYKRLMHVLFVRDKRVVEQEHLFTVANHFFDYCFSSKTWPSFYKLLQSTKNHPIARLLYTTMWYHLAGDGWKNWHADTLNELQKRCQNGGSVVYVAGGTDLYQLLDHGIYNIKVIDPMLPSQPDYYTEGWHWLVRGGGADGGIGDELVVPTKNKKLLLKRSFYQQTGFFNAKLSTGKGCKIPQSITDWQVYDQGSGRLVGKITYDRRFCQQRDFCVEPRQHLLMSFNELYFLTTNDQDGWGIQPQKLSNKFELFVKQLHRPINKHVVCHMSVADASSLNFIKLGSSIN